MADLRVRFIGDVGNLSSFFGAISGRANQTVNNLERLSRVNLSNLLSIPQTIARATGSTGIGRITLELDAYNNTIKQIAQTGVRLKGGGILPIGEVKTASANYAEFTEIIRRQTGEIETLRNATRAKNIETAKELELVRDLSQARAVELRTPFIPRQTEVQSRLDARRATLAQIDKALDLAYQGKSATGQFLPTDKREENLQALLKQRSPIIRGIARDQGILNGLEEKYQASLREDIALQELAARQTAIRAQRQAAAQSVLGTRRAFAAEQAAAFNQIPQIPTNLAYLKQLSPSLFQTLQKAGLGAGAGTLEQNLLTQQASASAPRADLVRGVTRLSGEFTTLKKVAGETIPVVQEWSAELDKSGKLTTRFGGQLSGAGQVLKQISRDFQKVIEWTVATTVVFGTLQYTISQLRNLSDLDYALQKFAITAQQSPGQARESFKQLSEVAFNTATPLLEIVGAADDIALATQKAGQSTEVWRREIIALTESVGVFTNLTGVDTVQATDLLTATMKQLQLTASDIPAILSKITAVAGGQSQAISDVAKGLSVMAEAGRVAGLSLDEQIATVQVLSQVTSKTPSEVATSFKNLVGSLESPGGLKVLKEFNILTRDQDTGGLRNILEVYKDINDAVSAGIIPASELQRVIRGISGGPRRAPDAAALLAAIDQISLAEAKSAQATNEAAIANAKAIDTIQAKFIQLQTVIDSVAFEKFGGEFKTAVGSMVTLLTGLLDAFNKIPSGAIAAAIQIGLFFVLIRTGTRGLLGFLSILNDIRLGFIAAGKAALGSVREVGLFNAAVAGGRGFLGNVGRNASRTLGGFAIGAGLTAATGGTGAQIAGGGLQGLGIALLAFPEPTLLTKIAGGIALLGGTLLQFADSSEKAADEGEKAARILDAFSQFKSASQDFDALTVSQEKLTNQINELNNTSKKTVDEQGQLSNAQREYASGLLAEIDATRQITEARQELIDILIISGNSKEQEVAQELLLAERYGVTGQALDDLVLKYQKILLLRQNPELVFPDLESIPSFDFTAPIAPQTGSTEVEYSRTIPGGRGGQPLTFRGAFDLTELEANANKVRDLFNEAGTALTSNFQVTGENIGLISDALDKLAESGDPAVLSMQQTFNAFVAQNDIITQTANNLVIYQSYIEGLKLIDPEKAAELQRVKDIIDSIVATTPQRDPNFIGPIQGPDVRTDALKLLEDSFRGGEIDYERLRALAEAYFTTLDEEAQAVTTPLAFITELFERSGIALDLLGIKAPEAMEGISEAAIAASEALGEVTESLGSGIIDRLAQVRADFQAGDIGAGVYKQSSAELRAYLELVNKIGPTFQDSISDIKDFEINMQSLQGQFSDIIGLENAASLTTDEFIERILTLADTYGLNGKQLEVLGIKLINFRKIVEELTKLQVNIPIGITLDKKSLTDALRILKVALIAAAGIANIFGGTADLSVINAQINAIETALGLLDKLDTSIGGINKQFQGGSGGGIGAYPDQSGTTKQKEGRDISELDVPEEILQSSQAQELIRQAIRNAKDLQKQIPGARKEAKNDLVVLLDGMNKILNVQGVKSEYLRKALEELAEVERKRLEFETKADTIRRIRVGTGDFSAIANVPVNSTTGVSLGGANGPINVTLNLNGTVLTPAQLAQFADLVAASLKKQIAGG